MSGHGLVMVKCQSQGISLEYIFHRGILYSTVELVWNIPWNIIFHSGISVEYSYLKDLERVNNQWCVLSDNTGDK